MFLSCFMLFLSWALSLSLSLSFNLRHADSRLVESMTIRFTHIFTTDISDFPSGAIFLPHAMHPLELPLMKTFWWHTLCLMAFLLPLFLNVIFIWFIWKSRLTVRSLPKHGDVTPPSAVPTGKSAGLQGLPSFILVPGHLQDDSAPRVLQAH